MKTSELVRRLWQADPSGDLECCVGGVDVLFVAQEPGYYDGSYEVLIRDNKLPYYDVTGAKVTKKGSKVQIHLHSIEDMLVDEPDMPVTFECCENKRCEHYIAVEHWRAEARQINEEVDREMAARQSNHTNAVTLTRVATVAEHNEARAESFGERLVLGLARVLWKASGR